jgi:hypothetical protein
LPSGSRRVTQKRGSDVKRDLIWLALALAFGVLALPALVHEVGVRTLGPYSRGGLQAFVADHFAQLASLEPAALLLSFGPLAVVAFWRLSRRLIGLR